MSDAKEYYCAKHGNVFDKVIESSLDRMKGNWCMLCALEALDRIGVNQVSEIGGEKK